MSMDGRTVYAIWYSLCCGAANRMAAPLLDKAGGCEAIYNARNSVASRWPEYRALGRKLGSLPLSAAQQVADWCEQNGVSVFYRGGALWPQSLVNIPCAPVLLYAGGKTEIFGRLDALTSITVVGTRQMSEHGAKAAYEFAYGLAATGMCVISGMADGVDSRAHTAALDAGGKTVSVWGCGIDRVYPAHNRQLADRIAAGGLIITEYAPGQKPEKQNFPQRNRIMAALGMGTLVIEAKVRSGSLITADMAAEYGRSVYAVMTDYDRKGADALRRLITDGAYAVSDVADIWNEYEREFGVKPDPEALDAAGRRLRESLPAPQILPSEPVSRPAAANSGYLLPDYVTGDAKAVYTALSATEPMHVDELADMLKITPMKISSALTLLELEGAVECLPGRHYIKNGK